MTGVKWKVPLKSTIKQKLKLDFFRFQMKAGIVATRLLSELTLPYKVNNLQRTSKKIIYSMYYHIFTMYYHT